VAHDQLADALPLRKLFRRLLPSHESVRQNRYIAKFGPRLQHPNLWHLNRRSVAGGVAAGMFAGLIPGSNPVQFTAGALLAIAFRVNLPIAVLLTLYSNPFTIVPLYAAAYALGQLALLRPVGEVPPLPSRLADQGYGDWLLAGLHWFASLGKPLLVGLPLLAVALALIGYFAIDGGWRLSVRCAWQRRRRERGAAR